MDKPPQNTSAHYSSVGSIACGNRAGWRKDSSNYLQGGSVHNPVGEENLGDCRHKVYLSKGLCQGSSMPTAIKKAHRRILIDYTIPAAPLGA
jgi:hypothetical protein